MSDDINANINITGESSGAITALDGAIGSVGQFDNSLKNLGDTFTKPLEHVGVHLFGRELLSTMGLAGEARVILPLLNLAVNETAAAFGIASGGIGLAVMGLAALAAVVYKVIEGQEKHKENLEKLITENQKNYSTTKDLVGILDKYKTKVGELPAPLALLLESEKKLSEQHKMDLLTVQGRKYEATLNEIRAKEDLIASNESLIASMKKEGQAYYQDLATGEVVAGELVATQTKKISDVNSTLKKQIDNLNASLITQHAGFYAVSQGAKDLNDLLKDGSKEADTYNKSIEKMNSQLAALNNLTKQYGAQDLALTGSVWQSKTAKINSELEKETHSIEDHYHKAIIAAKEAGKSTADINQAALNAINAAWKKADDGREAETAKWCGVTGGFMTMLSDIGSNTFKSMADGMGNAFAKMTVEGASWNKSMTALFKNLKEQFISAVTSMAIKWAAFQALKGLGIISTGGAGGAIVAGATFGAQGFVGTVSKPTTFVAGEGNEDEFVSIIPKSQMASAPHAFTPVMAGAGAAPAGAAAMAGAGAAPAGAAGGNTNNYFYFTAQGNNDPVGFAQKAMQYILRETRGRGQITVKSASIY